MRSTTSILIAGLLGLTSAAFAATPAEPATREARMAEARKNYEAQKPGMPSTTQAQPAKAATPHKAAKRHHAAKPSTKHQAKAPKAKTL